MNNSFLLLILTPSLVSIAFTGCSATTAQEAYDPASYQGEVDNTLPKDQQAKQFAVFRLLNGLQEGVGDETGLRIFVPGVEFREPFAAFFEGHKRLVRWDFGGPPQGTEVPVILCFDDRESGVVDAAELKRVERVYVVTGGGQRFSIHRR